MITFEKDSVETVIELVNLINEDEDLEEFEGYLKQNTKMDRNGGSLKIDSFTLYSRAFKGHFIKVTSRGGVFRQNQSGEKAPKRLLDAIDKIIIKLNREE